MGYFCTRVAIVFMMAALAAVASAQNRSNVASSEQFYVSDYKLTWLGAVEACHRMGKRLAVVDSEAKQNEIVRLVRASKVAFDPVQTHIWIGASDLVQLHEFVWHDTGVELRRGSGSYDNWAPGEPNNGSGGSERCAEMWYYPNGQKNWHWNDQYCGNTMFFVCETRPSHRCGGGGEVVQEPNFRDGVVLPSE